MTDLSALIQKDVDQYVAGCKSRAVRAGEELAAAIRAAAPKRSGALAASVQVHEVTGGVRVSTNSPYAQAVDRRTGFWTDTIREMLPRIETKIFGG